jgi:chitin disaccharide deacetylase
LKRVIFTGDDFGLALPVNEAIIEAHRNGVLTTASLMVGSRFARDAVERARECPSLRMGLHLVLVEGKPVLDSRSIPDLVDSNGEFLSHLTRAGFKFFFYPGIRKQLEAEIRAQFEAFQRTGFRLDHVNTHNHMHLHPTILHLLLKVGCEFGLRAVRLPNEPPLRSWKASRKLLGSRLVSFAFLWPWIKLMKMRLQKAHVSCNDFVFGMADSGAMTLDLVLRMIRNLPDGVTEIYMHPATGRSPELDRTMPNYRHEDEFTALLSKLLFDAMSALQIKRIAFGDLQ